MGIEREEKEGSVEIKMDKGEKEREKRRGKKRKRKKAKNGKWKGYMLWPIFRQAYEVEKSNLIPH